MFGQTPKGESMYEVLAIIAVIYLIANTLFTLSCHDRKAKLSLWQIVLGVLSGLPILFITILIVWGLPMAFPERFRVGGDRREE